METKIAYNLKVNSKSKPKLTVKNHDRNVMRIVYSEEKRLKCDKR